MSTCVILFTVHVLLFFPFFIYNTLFICAPWLVKQVVGEHLVEFITQVVREHLEFISQTGGQGAFGQVY